MALTLSRRDLDDAYARVSSARDQLQRYSGTGEQVVGQTLQTLEVAAGAAANGYLSGRYGALRLADSGALSNVPLDLAGALGLHALALFGVAGKHGEHLHNFADGVLAGYVTKFMIGFGSTQRAKAGQPSLPAIASPRMAGALPQSTNAPPRAKAPLTEAELAAMAQNAR